MPSTLHAIAATLHAQPPGGAAAALSSAPRAASPIVPPTRTINLGPDIVEAWLDDAPGVVIVRVTEPVVDLWQWGFALWPYAHLALFLILLAFLLARPFDLRNSIGAVLSLRGGQLQCTDCGYDLTNAPPKNPCPECTSTRRRRRGEPVHAATLRRSLLRTLPIGAVLVALGLTLDFRTILLGPSFGLQFRPAPTALDLHSPALTRSLQRNNLAAPDYALDLTTRLERVTRTTQSTRRDAVDHAPGSPGRPTTFGAQVPDGANDRFTTSFTVPLGGPPARDAVLITEDRALGSNASLLRLTLDGGNAHTIESPDASLAGLNTLAFSGADPEALFLVGGVYRDRDAAILRVPTDGSEPAYHRFPAFTAWRPGSPACPDRAAEPLLAVVGDDPHPGTLGTTPTSLLIVIDPATMRPHPDIPRLRFPHPLIGDAGAVAVRVAPDGSRLAVVRFGWRYDNATLHEYDFTNEPAAVRAIRRLADPVVITRPTP